MNTVIILSYASLLLLSAGLSFYSIWCYYECPVTRSHRPYVLPVFVSVGWFFFAINGLVTQATRLPGPRVDVPALTLLAAATLVSLAIFITYYRRGRANETFREKNSL